MNGTLFVVATPIGNLDDLTPRARHTLAEVTLIAAEDTRRTRRLLSHFGIKTRQIALHEHNEAARVNGLVADLSAGKSIALVADAGTPLVSDPGYRLVKAAHENGITVVPIPGASAVVAALSVAGLPTDRFCFEGFPPARSAARRKAFTLLAGEQRTLIFFESVHRLKDTLEDMIGAFGGDRDAFIGRELTKVHEQCVSATLDCLLARVHDETIPTKGEFVIVVRGGERGSAAVDTDRLLVELADRLPAREAAAIASRVTGVRRNELYRRVLELRARLSD